jgi:uncharacterized membrane protein YkoI
MRTHLIFPALAIALIATNSASAYTGQSLARHARITMARASAIALDARQGRITDRELEYELGGSGLRYSFGIRRNGVTYEVGVDARTGRVLENRREGQNPD